LFFLMAKSASMRLLPASVGKGGELPLPRPAEQGRHNLEYVGESIEDPGESPGGTSSTWDGRNRVKEWRQLPNQRARTSCRMKSMIGKTTMDRKPVSMPARHGQVGIFVRMSRSAFNPTMALLS